MNKKMCFLLRNNCTGFPGSNCLFRGLRRGRSGNESRVGEEEGEEEEGEEEEDEEKGGEGGEREEGEEEEDGEEDSFGTQD